MRPTITQEEAAVIALFDILRTGDGKPLSRSQVVRALVDLGLVECEKAKFLRFKEWMLGDDWDEAKAREAAQLLWRVTQWLLLHRECANQS